MWGIGAGLTHGLIRTTLAVRSIGYSDEHPTALQLHELAAGLAYWATMYVEQPAPASLSGTDRPATTCCPPFPGWIQATAPHWAK